MLHYYTQQQKINPLMNSLETTMKELLELNTRTLQNFSHSMPLDLSTITTNPQHAFEKNVKIIIENNYHMMNYMQHMLNIMERQMLGHLDQVKTTSPAVHHETNHTSKKSSAKRTTSNSIATHKKSASATKTASPKKTTATKTKKTSANGVKSVAAKTTHSAKTHAANRTAKSTAKATPTKSTTLHAGKHSTKPTAGTTTHHHNGQQPPTSSVSVPTHLSQHTKNQ